MGAFQNVLACNKCDGNQSAASFVGYAGCELDLQQSVAIVAVAWINCSDLADLQANNKTATMGVGNDSVVSALLEGFYAANGIVVTPLKVVNYDLRPIEKTYSAVGIASNRREEETRTVGHRPVITFRGSWQAALLADSILTQNLPANTDINLFFGNKVGTTQSTYAQEQELFMWLMKNRWQPFFIRGNAEFGYIVDIPQDFNQTFLKPKMNIKKLEVAENDDIYRAYELDLNYGQNTVIDLEKKEYCILDYASAPTFIDTINSILV